MASLQRRRIGRRGQIATLLLLVIIGVLAFVLTTANMGQMSVQATRMANAADSSALLLGSQLASHSRFLWESLGRTEKKCKKGGLLALVLAIVFAVAALVIAPYLTPMATTTIGGVTIASGSAGVAAGAIGGALEIGRAHV